MYFLNRKVKTVFSQIVLLRMIFNNLKRLELKEANFTHIFIYIFINVHFRLTTFPSF